MKNWKYTDRTNQVVSWQNESCSINSVEMQEWLAQGNVPLPSDPVPNPAIAVIDAKLSDIDFRSIRPVREGDTVFLSTLTAQVVELRAARALLPKMV